MRADQISAVILEALPAAIVASRSERAILADIERALTAPEAPQRRRLLGRRLAEEHTQRRAASSLRSCASRSGVS